MPRREIFLNTGVVFPKAARIVVVVSVRIFLSNEVVVPLQYYGVQRFSGVRA